MSPSPTKDLGQRYLPAHGATLVAHKVFIAREPVLGRWEMSPGAVELPHLPGRGEEWHGRQVEFVAMATPEDLNANAEFIRLADSFVEVPGGSNKNNYANVDLITSIASARASTR